MLAKKLQALFNPERYHGWGRTKGYFEGWYYKVISADEEHAYAFIPGVAMDIKGKKQAFVQILNGKEQTAAYHQYPYQAFNSQANRFYTTIANNEFEINRIKLDLPGLSGQLEFHAQVPWPNQWYSPGIMGPFAFVPFMECYHGILSMDHSIEGQLLIGNKLIDFTGGRGYMEKDWGHSFPSAYIWMQSNHFQDQGVSIKASVAKIPWLGSSFVGFIAGLYLNDKLYEFTTYNRTRLLKSAVDQNKVVLVMANSRYRLEVDVDRSASTELASPIQGFMDGRISESMTSLINVRLIDARSGELLFEDHDLSYFSS
jgi:tocopherol cyclase